MASIRCVKNCILKVLRDGEPAEEKFVFGRWYMVDYLEELPEGYVNIYYKNGDVVAGVKRSLFEVGNATIKSCEEVKEIQEEVVSTLPPATDLEKPIRGSADILSTVGNPDGKPIRNKKIEKPTKWDDPIDVPKWEDRDDEPYENDA